MHHNNKLENYKKLLQKHPSQDFIEILLSYANDIYTTLGSGFSEVVYHKAFAIHLRENQIPYESESAIPIKYRGHYIGSVRSDIILHRPTSKEPFFVIEFKATVKPPGSPEIAQLKTYLKNLDLKNGLIINFPQPGLNSYREDVNEVDYIPIRI